MAQVTCQVLNADGNGIHGIKALLNCEEYDPTYTPTFTGTSDANGMIRGWAFANPEGVAMTPPITFEVPTSVVTVFVQFLVPDHKIFCRVQTDVDVTMMEPIHLVLFLSDTHFLVELERHAPPPATARVSTPPGDAPVEASDGAEPYSPKMSPLSLGSPMSSRGSPVMPICKRMRRE